MDIEDFDVLDIAMPSSNRRSRGQQHNACVLCCQMGFIIAVVVLLTLYFI